MTMDELVDALPDESRHRLNDNMTPAVKDGLVDRKRDDVTGLPLYTITKIGIERLKIGVGSHGGKARKPSVKCAASPVKSIAPGVAESIHAPTLADEEAMPPADADLLAKANRMLSDRLAGVAHALRGSGLPALANIDEGEDMQQYVAALTGAYQIVRANQVKPIFWLAFSGSNGISPTHCDDEQDARKQAELLALQGGTCYVCAVMAECAAEIVWKEAA